MFNIDHSSNGWVQNVPEIHQPQEPGMWRGWPPDPPMEKSGFQCTLCRWVPSTPGMREVWNTGFRNVVMGNIVLPQTAVRLPPLLLTFNITLTLTLNIWNTSDMCVRHIYFTDRPIIYGLFLSQKRSVSQSCKMKTVIWKRTGNAI